MKVEIIRRERLGEGDGERMFRLHAAYFDNVRAKNFRRDLAEKDWVILLREADRILGFSTIRFFDHDASGSRVLFSGDTIVDKSKRQTCCLAGAFGHLLRRFRPADRPFFWLLICKGYRTYRFLPTFFRQFDPGPGTNGGPLAALRNAIAAERFGPAYDRETGIVRFNGNGDFLRPDHAGIAAAHSRDPFVRFFLERNPGFRIGDELACLAPLAEENLNSLAKRLVARTRVEWVE
ncbi:MAG: hypothetical protein ACLFN9_15875 [Desulfococcaceae bacterium]